MTTTTEETTQLVGAPVKRVEDARLVTGAAKYLDDLQLPGMAHAAILRSPFAHARINSIDTTKAAAHPGVIAVYTGKDFEQLPALPCAWQAGGVENFVNTPRAVPESYRRYLTHQLREQLALTHAPIKLILRPRREGRE